MHTGAEVALTRAVELSDGELEALYLADGPWLLLEPPITPAAAGVEAALLMLADRGHQMILAHPERIPGFQREPAIVDRLVERGMLCQLTASSLVGRFGRDVQRFSERLLHDGLIHVVASDAHSTRTRSPAVTSVLRTAGLPPAWVQWLCEEVPASVVSGGLVTSPPGTSAVHPIRRRLLRSR